MDKLINIKKAAKIFANFNLFASIEAQLESGCLYGEGGSGIAANKIRMIARREQTRLLELYDEIVAKEIQ